MFFFLSKTIYVLLMPTSWVLMLALWAYFSKFEKRRKKILLSLITLLFILYNNFLVNEIFLWWERPATPFATMKTYDVGIILTGYTNDGAIIKDRVNLNQAADRIVHAIRLYKEKKIKNILICGAEHDLFADTIKTKASYRSSKEVLLLAGVPDSVIFIENNSRNTRENALFGKQKLDKIFPKQKYLLITSAFHIRRAEGCFQKVGLEVNSFSVDFVAKKRTFHPNITLIPQESAFANWGKIVHELTGYVVYKIMGYI